MKVAHTNRDDMSLSWSFMKKSSFDAVVVNEDLDSSQTSEEDTGRIRSLSVPPADTTELSQTWGPSRRQETYIEMIKDIGTNIKYNFNFLSQSLWIKDTQDVKKAYLLGKEYDIHIDGEDHLENLAKLKKAFTEIIWFTYRKNFPSLVSRKLLSEESYVSDTSWGCTIRSCQMLLAQCLKFNHQQGLSDNPSLSSLLHNTEKLNRKLDRKLIGWFLDCELDAEKAPYSIQNISSYIYENSQIKPGNWLKPSTVLFALQGIHQKAKNITAPGLQFDIYLEGTIYIDQAVNKVHDFESEFVVVEDKDDSESLSPQDLPPFEEKEQEQPEVQSINNIIADPVILELFEEDAAKVEHLLNRKWKESIVIVVLAKIGLEKPNPEYLPYIKELFSFPECIGMLGGKPGLAYYIAGCVDDRLIYLDPHFVQEAVQDKRDLRFRDYMNTYFCNSIRYLNLNEIDTSVGFAFYIKNEAQFKDFVKRFKESSQKPESFLGIEANAPREDVADFESVDGEDEFETIATNPK